MSSEHGSRPSRLPTSRAYWELKAEQVMNRVFTPVASIDLEIIETRPSSPPASAPVPPAAERAPAQVAAPASPGPAEQPLPLAAAVGMLALGLAGGGAAGWGFWLQHQQALQQERNLLLIERLRNLDPGARGSRTHATASATGNSSGSGPELPPPPPDEPWMQELAALPSATAPPARVLKVPAGQAIGSPPPPAQRDTSAEAVSTPVPQLVGVIQTQGQPGTAIFQIGGNSTSTAIGERIGSSGWQLKSAGGDSATIERGGIQRRLQIQSGF